MHEIFASQTISVTELKRSYSKVLREAEGEAVAVLNNNRPEAYLVPADAYERLMDRLEDLEDMITVLERKDGPFVEVDINELV